MACKNRTHAVLTLWHLRGVTVKDTYGDVTMKEGCTLKSFHTISGEYSEPGEPCPLNHSFERHCPGALISADVNEERKLRLAGGLDLEPAHHLPGQGLGKADCVTEIPDMLGFGGSSLFLESQWHLSTSFFLLFCLSDRLFLYNPGWTGTHSIPALTSQILGPQAYVLTPGSLLHSCWWSGGMCHRIFILSISPSAAKAP